MPLFILAATAIAQVTAAAPPAVGERDDVLVITTRDPFRMNAAVLRAAETAFLEGRSAFAPAATLSFVAEQRGGGAIRPLALRLTDGVRTLPIPVDAEGRFSLPALPAGKWRLVADRPRKAMMVRPLVLSPGGDRLDQRLGDARLQCRVFWAMTKAGATILAAPVTGLFDLAGACDSRRIGIYQTTPRKIRTAFLQDATRSVPLGIAPSRRSYRLPLADNAFGNDARIRAALE